MGIGLSLSLSLSAVWGVASLAFPLREKLIWGSPVSSSFCTDRFLGKECSVSYSNWDLYQITGLLNYENFFGMGFEQECAAFH